MFVLEQDMTSLSFWFVAFILLFCFICHVSIINSHYSLLHAWNVYMNIGSQIIYKQALRTSGYGHVWVSSKAVHCPLYIIVKLSRKPLYKGQFIWRSTVYLSARDISFRVIETYTTITLFTEPRYKNIILASLYEQLEFWNIIINHIANLVWKEFGIRILCCALIGE